MTNQKNSIPHYLHSNFFYLEVKKRIHQIEKPITLVTLDFDNFNYINDLFSYEVGDQVLNLVTNHFSSMLNDDEVFSRIHADHFIFCLSAENTTQATSRFQELSNLNNLLDGLLPAHYNLVVSSGMIVIHDDKLSLSALLDKINYARKKAKGNASNSFSFYDENMNNEIEWQKYVTYAMSSALQNNEFEMYLQPKVLIESGKIVGAEALVRWNSAQHGMIYPDRFIPIMEQNGFIRRIDFFMLEEACRFLKACAKKGDPPLPISVNFSRAHLSNKNLVEQIFHTVNQMGVATKLIEIEFTENLSVDGFEQLIEIVTDLKLLGFKVSLDDFGNAYSSLSCLKDLPIDIIKIDKGFLDTSVNSDNGKLIVSKIVELIKSLRKVSVMEGVETEDETDFLKKLSCDLGQGYFYAKPMPTDNYLDYLRKGSVVLDIEAYLSNKKESIEKEQLLVIPEEFQMDNWELYTLGKNIDMGLMKGYLDGDTTVQYVNDRALEYLGYTRQEFRELFQNSIMAFIHPDDAHIVKKSAVHLIHSGKPVAFETRAIRKDGKVIVLRGRSSSVVDKHGRSVGIYAFQDVTEELEKTNRLEKSIKAKISELEATIESERKTKEALRISEERYRFIVEQSEDIMFEWDFDTDTITFSEKYVALFDQIPLTENLTTNTGIRQRIHTDDLIIFEEWVTNTYKKSGQSEFEYRIKNAEGAYIWMRCHSTAMCDDNGTPIKTIGVFSDVTTQKNQLNTLLIKAQRDPLTKLLNKTETQHKIIERMRLYPKELGAFFIIDIDNFKGLNDNLGHQFGDTVLEEIAKKVQILFRDTDVVGRIGGDEIAVYVGGCNADTAKQKADLLAKSLHISYYGSAMKYNISASIGIALYPTHGQDFKELYNLADIALYASKKRGKDQYTLYNSALVNTLDQKRTPVEWSQSFLSTYFQEDFPFQVFEMLYESRDIRASIDMILEILGKRFNVDRVYVFQNDTKCQLVNSTYEWCAPGIVSGVKHWQHLVHENLQPYLNAYSNEGIYCCPDIRNTDSIIYDICAHQGIKSLLHCGIYNEGSMSGFIGFDTCNDYHNWTGEEIAVLGYISRILSVFMIKTNTLAALDTSYNNHAEMLDNLEGYVYVVDPKNYKVLYVNRAIKNIGIDSGKTCYYLAFGRDSPCTTCPINQLSDTTHSATEEIFSKELNRWVLSSASKITWEGTQEAILIYCMDISKYKK